MYIYIYIYVYIYVYIYMYMVSAGIIERKLRRTKVRLFTVPCCSIILFSSEGMKKNVSDLPPNFFRRSIILVGALLFYNSVFPHFSHISLILSSFPHQILILSSFYPHFILILSSFPHQIFILSAFYLHFLIKSSLNPH